MKRKVYICISICIVVIALFTWNCSDSEIIKSSSEFQNKDFSLQEAKLFFENQIESYPIKSRSKEKDHKRRLSLGDFVPDWGSAKASSQKNLACYDIPIAASNYYNSIQSEYKNGKASAYISGVYQKLIIVKDKQTNILGQYILTLIPDKNNEVKYKKDILQKFINCSDKGDFTGIALYTIPQLDLIIRVNKYVNGVKTSGVFLSGKRELITKKIAVAKSILQNISIKQRSKVSTRSFGEDDWTDNWQDNITMDGDDWIFVDEEGNRFTVTDADGDGEPETIVISPEEPPFVWPDPDPFPDPVPDIEDYSCYYCGSPGCSGECMDAPDEYPEEFPDESESKAKKIFRNSKMTDQNWDVLEKMMQKIMENCMGQALVNGLTDMLNGSTLTIGFNSNGYSSFNFTGNAGISVDMSMESNQLFHEMWHAYQAYQETANSYSNSLLNLEIEAHYAQYLYLQSLPEYDGSKWESWYDTDDRFMAIAGLDDYVSNHGNLISGANQDLFDNYLEYSVVSNFKQDPTYSTYNYNSNRTSISNFSNLSTLTADC